MKVISLGELSPEKFLRDYWQKKPLLVRNAISDFQDLLTYEELINLACQEDSQSRLITKRREKWFVKNGPLSSSNFSSLDKKQWSLLVHDINHILPSARDLLQKFSFIPYARLDDLMVSYAPKGGGIGPHIDSYDVFLLQGKGSKRWQITSQQDNSLIEDIPLKILRNFNPEQEWVLTAGDMLYLPPNYAHNGMAENDCMTYSIGFCAPSHQELIDQFLIYLQDNIKVDGWYSDPDIKLQPHPAIISSSMLDQTKTILEKIKWDNIDIANFLGTYLTEPKPHIFFNQPLTPLSQTKFLQQVLKAGLQLDLKSHMLVKNNKFFLNGDAYVVGAGSSYLLQSLADNQKLSPGEAINKEISDLLYQWYLYGYILLINEAN
ncbi:MAG: cupin domain-containing protein [Nitrosomonas sp.]|nr:cupin domain-containing protein [Nitrosomonas sp.]MDP1950056.1 cupin domain-containing protein [Nitrosomonas sp.]